MDRHLRTTTIDAALLKSEDLSFLDRLVQATHDSDGQLVLAGGDGIEYSVVLPETAGARHAALSAIRQSGPTAWMDRLFGVAVASEIDVVRFAPATPMPRMLERAFSLDDSAPAAPAAL